MIAALHALLEGEVQKIVLARPAVEAGEALGFLPGDLEEKLLPYLRPLYDAMDEVLGPVEARKLVETGVVEIAPLAYMRGRTLGKCFALLDEAQNTTKSQMMMFLTRLGEGSKMVVTEMLPKWIFHLSKGRAWLKQKKYYLQWMVFIFMNSIIRCGPPPLS